MFVCVKLTVLKIKKVKYKVVSLSLCLTFKLLEISGSSITRPSESSIINSRKGKEEVVYTIQNNRDTVRREKDKRFWIVREKAEKKWIMRREKTSGRVDER